MAEHLASISGTEEDRVNCPFYIKMGACRHGDGCSCLHTKPSISPTLLLSNLYQRLDMIYPGVDVHDNPVDHRKIQQHFEDFYEDLFEELSKYGEIESLNVCDNLSDHMVGNVYVVFREEEQAENALRNLRGRFYSGRPIIVDFSPVTNFRDATCRQYEENTCGRGGVCNFIHLKSISRRLRELYGRYKNRHSPSRTRNPYKHRHEERSHGRQSRRNRYVYNSENCRSISPHHRRHRSRVREGSEERRAMIEKWNREKEEQESASKSSEGADNSCNHGYTKKDNYHVERSSQQEGY